MTRRDLFKSLTAGAATTAAMTVMPRGTTPRPARSMHCTVTTPDGAVFDFDVAHIERSPDYIGKGPAAGVLLIPAGPVTVTQR